MVPYPRRILITLSPPLWIALRDLAEREFRDPRRQAELIITQALAQPQPDPSPTPELVAAEADE